MPAPQTIYVEGETELDSNIYNSICSLDLLPTESIIKSIIVDYVYYRICCEGYKDLNLFINERGQTRNNRLLDIIMTKIVLRAEEFERKFKPRFENRNALLISTPEQAQLDYMETLENIWSDQLANWGRFLGYISFVGSYCTGCLRVGMVFIIKVLVEYAIMDLDRKMGKWILAHGGWRGLYTALKEMKLN